MNLKVRVVNVDLDRQKPFFAFESNFLDWYERWLDEIIPENVMIDEPELFQYTLGGSVVYILEMYFLLRMIMKPRLEVFKWNFKERKNRFRRLLMFLEEQYKLSSGRNSEKQLLQILTKFDYQRAYPYLVDFTKESLLDVFQFVFWYAKDKSSDWLECYQKQYAENINDEETFRFCTYLLKEMNIDYGDIIVPFTFNENENIRIRCLLFTWAIKE